MITAIQILQLIVSVLPTAVTLTEDFIKAIQAIETGVNASPGTPEHIQAVNTLQSLGTPTQSK